jgi:hypothetical protein
MKTANRLPATVAACFALLLALALTPTAALATAPLPTPGDVRAVHIADTSADLWWTRSGASAQDVVERHVGGGWQEHARGLFGSLALTGLDPGTTYTFRVYSLPVEGLGYTESARSAPVSFTTLAGPDAVAPATPTTPTFSGVTTTSINVFWPEATDNVQVTGYHLQQLVGGGWATIRTVGASTGARSQTVSGLSAATAYTFAVIAFDARGNLSPRSAAATVTTLTATPAMTCRVQVLTFGAGFQANIILLNTTPTTVNGWTVRFSLPATVPAGSLFGGVLARDGSTGSITPAAYNAAITPGGRATIGFSGWSSPAPITPPTGFTLDGVPCATV